MDQLTSKKTLSVSFGVDVADIVLNLIAALLTGSVIMVAEALQGFFDLLTTGFLLIGHHRSRKRADSRFQFGRGQEIYFWTISALFLMFFITGLLSIYLGWRRFVEPRLLDNLWLAFLILVIAVVTNFYAFWLSAKRLRQNTRLSGLWESFRRSPLVEIKTAVITDLMGFSAAGLGLIALLIYVLTDDYRFDGVGAVMIGLSVAGWAVILIKELRHFISGRSADKELLAKIKELAAGVSGVKGVSDLRTIYLGSEKLLINLDILVNDSLSAEEAGDIIAKIKERLMENIPDIGHIQIELDN